MSEVPVRPLLYARIRLYRGGQGEYLRDLLQDDQEDLLEELGQLRAAGKPEDDPEVMEVRTTLGHNANTLRDVSGALIELAGPNEDVRR